MPPFRGPRRWLAATLLALSLAACGRLESTHVITGQAFKPHAGGVTVVMQGQQPTRPFVEVAVLQSQGIGNKAEMPLVIDALRKEASSLGANAVINVRIDQGSNSVSASGVAVYMR